MASFEQEHGGGSRVHQDEGPLRGGIDLAAQLCLRSIQSCSPTPGNCLHPPSQFLHLQHTLVTTF
jgi:hypothetical protein